MLFRGTPMDTRLWRMGDSNPRPIDCEPIALPTELIPRNGWYISRGGEKNQLPANGAREREFLPSMSDNASPSGGLTARILKRALSSAMKTAWLLLRIMVPVSFAAAALEWLGAMRFLAVWLDPVMKFVGLPGSASLAIISSIFINIYSAIAVIGTLGLSGRALTIIAIMCLMAHNLPVEVAVMKKTGSSVFRMIFLRVFMMILAGLVFNAALPGKDQAQEPAAAADQADFPVPASSSQAVESAIEPDSPIAPEAQYVRPPFLVALKAWGLSTLGLLVKMVVLIVLVMILQKLLEETGVMTALSKISAPFLKILGLPAGTSVLWIVIQVVGYAYGAAVLIDQVNEGKLTSRDGDLLNHHAAICHSLLEDTVLFAAIGAPILWITLPRLALAFAVVWIERARRWLFRKSFEVGTL